ncbi:MAG: hypothetical protein H7Z43_04270 [Clostridia bacterium]|nr:hypothetical protein [Deltaproteobacteria bacterium]
MKVARLRPAQRFYVSLFKWPTRQRLGPRLIRVAGYNAQGKKYEHAAHATTLLQREHQSKPNNQLVRFRGPADLRGGVLTPRLVA